MGSTRKLDWAEAEEFYLRYDRGMIEKYPHPVHSGNYYFGVPVQESSKELKAVACLEHYYKGFGILSKLLVQPQYRRKGLATELLVHRIEFGYFNCGIRTFMSFIHKDNEASLGFAKKHGFTPAGYIEPEHLYTRSL